MANMTIEHIVVDPNIHQGKPHVAGKGVRVQHIAAVYQHGATADSIAEDYGLTLAEVHSALAYYYDHKAEVDQAIQEGIEQVESVGTSAQELIRKLESRKLGE